MNDANWAAVVGQGMEKLVAFLGRIFNAALIALVIWVIDPANVGATLQWVWNMYVHAVEWSATEMANRIDQIIQWLRRPPFTGPAHLPAQHWWATRAAFLGALVTLLPLAAGITNVIVGGWVGSAVIVFSGIVSLAVIGLFRALTWVFVEWADITVAAVQKPINGAVRALVSILQGIGLSVPTPEPGATDVVKTEAIKRHISMFWNAVTMGLASYHFILFLSGSPYIFALAFILSFGGLALVSTGRVGGFAMLNGLRWYYRALATVLVLAILGCVFGALFPTTFATITGGTAFDTALAAWLGTVGAQFKHLIGARAFAWVSLGAFGLVVLGLVVLVVKLLTMRVPTKEEAAQVATTESGGNGVGAVVATVLVLAAVGTFAYFAATRTSPTPIATVVAVAAPVAAPTPPAPVQHTGVGTGAANVRLAYVRAHADECPQTAANPGRYGDPRLACRAETVQVRLQRLAAQ